MIKRLCYIFCFFVMVFGVNAQDIHFSYFQLSPLTLNPALAGNYEGTFRVGGIYRDQGFTVNATEAYRTPSVYVDAPVIRGIRKQDWIGIGVGFVNDQAGAGGLRKNTTYGIFSYHLPLDKKMKNVLSFGIQSGSTQTRINNWSNYRFEDAIIGGGVTSEKDPGQNTQNRADWAGGVTLKGDIDKVSSFRTGLSISHLNRPDISVLATGSERLNWRYTFFGQYSRALNQKLSLTPSLLFQHKKKENEVAFNGMLGFDMFEGKDIVLNAGLGFRVNFFSPVDALVFLWGVDIGDLRVGLSYDATLSGLSKANSTVGGLEI